MDLWHDSCGLYVSALEDVICQHTMSGPVVRRAEAVGRSSTEQPRRAEGGPTMRTRAHLGHHKLL